jgi:hypothetical protein
MVILNFISLNLSARDIAVMAPEARPQERYSFVIARRARAAGHLNHQPAIIHAK